MFEVFIKETENFSEWDFNAAQPIKPTEIQGHRIPVNIDEGKITGEIIIAKRPLTDDEKGIAIMIGNHIVIRTNFGFDNKLGRVTGNLRCDSLSARFADKSALIEDDEYTKFNQIMKGFIIDSVIPTLTEYEDVLITREESRIYREIDKVLGQAVIENIETAEQTDNYEIIDVNDEEKRNVFVESDNRTLDTSRSSLNGGESHGHNESDVIITQTDPDIYEKNDFNTATQHDSELERINTDKISAEYLDLEKTTNEIKRIQTFSGHNVGDIHSVEAIPEVIKNKEKNNNVASRLATVRKPVLKKTFALKKVGYKVIPYEDDTDSRYSFTTENVVFVNKANSTYRAEASRGDEFLMRHIISIVAEAIAKSKHPEGKDALELQNRLVAEAIRIHDHAPVKR
jgi:hypothetical protein